MSLHPVSFVTDCSNLTGDSLIDDLSTSAARVGDSDDLIGDCCPERSVANLDAVKGMSCSGELDEFDSGESFTKKSTVKLCTNLCAILPAHHDLPKNHA